jgi:hypothetical protein
VGHKVGCPRSERGESLDTTPFRVDFIGSGRHSAVRQRRPLETSMAYTGMVSTVPLYEARRSQRGSRQRSAGRDQGGTTAWMRYAPKRADPMRFTATWKLRPTDGSNPITKSRGGSSLAASVFQARSEKSSKSPHERLRSVPRECLWNRPSGQKRAQTSSRWWRQD